MAAEGYKRKLTAIMSADVAGYSRLMGEDESATVKTLEAYKQIMFALIKQHRGRLIDSPGDNLLAEFASVVDAVQCGVAVQNELKARNADLPENRRMQFRIGINLGDVIEEGDRIYGDGVNIAARLESLADPGGICISKTAFDQIETKLPLGYQFLGEQTVKNISKPVGAYKVLMETRVIPSEVKSKGVPDRRRKSVLAGALGVLIVIIGVGVWNFYWRAPKIEPASVERMAFPLPDKPSIAVLPFANMSGDPEQEYFSDGITEEIITALSKIGELFVIARNSGFTYKGKPVKVQQVAEELGVRYVLEGSVRKAGNRVRITAQLVDAITGHHLWAERYDRDLKDIFALQDEITKKIITALQVQLTLGEGARLLAKGTKNIEAYMKLLQGWDYLLRMNKESNILARKMAEEVIALDPDYPRAYRLLAMTHWFDAFLRWGNSPGKSLANAEELSEKVLAMDESDSGAHTLLGYIYLLKGEHDKAIAEAERAVALAPNASGSQAALGFFLNFAGRPEEAIVWYKKAIRLDPIPIPLYYLQLGHIYRNAGRYEEAISELKKALHHNPDNLLAHLHLTGAYSSLGREEKARGEADEVLRIDPKFSLDYWAKTIPYKNQADKDRLVGALRKAGLK
jgi:adenylate cyclase